MNGRSSEYPIQPYILNRWSPRAMTGEEMTDSELMPLFEAARWAPSSYNAQPWKFLYAKRNTVHWNIFFNLLTSFNQSWTAKASCLVIVLSKIDRKTHSYDTGAAWVSLAFEGNARGYVVHGMEGFDYDRAKKDLKIPATYQVEAMIAIGKKAPKETLSKDLQAKEIPSSRVPLQAILQEGSF